jgi:uncharacterized protein with FMN-binding domain
MRKYTIGVAVAVIFLAYSLVLRHQHTELVVVPARQSQNNSATKSTLSLKSSTTSTNTNLNTASGSSSNATPTLTSKYKDGTYTGSVENAFYGNVQIAAVIKDGQIGAVNFLEYPNENPNSLYINQQAVPQLKQEAIKAQSSNVSIVTGATLTSQAFIQSLANALSQAMQSK